MAMIKKIGFLTCLVLCIERLVHHKIEQDYHSKQVLACAPAEQTKTGVSGEQRKTRKRLLAQIGKSSTTARGKMTGQRIS
jgi:hypothetical protein